MTNKANNKQARERDNKELRFSWWLQTVGAGAENRFAGLITAKLRILFRMMYPNRVFEASPTPSNSKPKRNNTDGSNLVIESSERSQPPCSV
jgi:hypothetical protein